ncbi:unnamed protein product [Dicrocoelium dendriticum]|nr:unnamed protein product [Dicrocoelium dendriticum]
MRGVESHAPPEQRIRSALFAVNGTHHLVSFLTRLVPSPDWCTGLSRVDICLPNCSWPLHLQFRLEPWDAGVIAGDTYLPSDQPERLREPKPMCPITPELRPNTPFTVLTDYMPVSAGLSSTVEAVDRPFGPTNRDEPELISAGLDSFIDPKLSPKLQEQIRLMHSTANGRIRRRFARLGTVYLELLRINENDACNPEPLQDDQGIQRGIPTSVEASASDHCKLSSWSKWGPCSTVDINSCPTPEAKTYWSKRLPRTQRTRFILPPSKSIDCGGVPLREEKTCDVPVVKESCDGIQSDPSRMGRRLSLAACQSVPWGPWSECMNVSCGRPGMIYRWREFPDIDFKRACEGYPFVSQVDTCWPPPKGNCDPGELKKACFEEPPTSLRLCVRPHNGTTRYYFHPSERQCKPFDYVPGCHLRALMSGHVIGLTRNVFVDKNSCEEMCSGASSAAPDATSAARQMFRRAANACALPVDYGTHCLTQSPRQMWHYDAAAHVCLSFMFTGCGGNLNAFPSLRDCKETCE